jgi:hypothetical protein
LNLCWRINGRVPQLPTKNREAIKSGANNQKHTTLIWSLKGCRWKRSWVRILIKIMTNLKRCDFTRGETFTGDD